MKKEFVPYEQALALKELGFNEPCFGYYTSPDGLTLEQPDGKNGQFVYFAPLYQQAFRWFREKFESTIHIYQYQDTQRWDFDVYDNTPEEEDFGNPSYDTYEEAELACLKKLIEIVKNK